MSLSHDSFPFQTQNSVNQKIEVLRKGLDAAAALFVLYTCFYLCLYTNINMCSEKQKLFPYRGDASSDSDPNHWTMKHSWWEEKVLFFVFFFSL